jgi:hypothetical protein
MNNDFYTKPLSGAVDAEIRDPRYLRNLMKLRSGYALGANDAVATGQIFLQSELNKADTRLHMPLEGHTWYRDLPLVNGGGWVDTETAEFVSVYGPNVDAFGTESNDIGVVNFNRSQDVYPTRHWQRSIRIPLVDSLKLAQANKSPNDILDKAVKTDWNKTLDRRVYLGSAPYPGLVNQTAITSTAAPNGTQTSPGPSWNSKNPIDIYNDFNSMAQTAWAASGYSLDAVLDRFLIPATAYTKLLQPMVLGGVMLTVNVLEYIKKNYFGITLNGVVPEIYPLPYWAETAGASNSRRMIGYKFSDDNLNFGILQNIQRYGGPLSLQDGAFVATYVGNTGIVKILRPTTALYYDQL